MTIEVWYQDEARIGQKNHITRRWAPKGTRPRATKDQRTMWAYIFGAICPERGVGTGLVMPYCNTHAMQKHLKEISRAVAPGSHAAIIVDRAGWHTTKNLNLPANITLIPLPPRSPELNPIENLWQYMRGRYFGNQIFRDYNHIVEVSCWAWNEVMKAPRRIMSIGRRDYYQVRA